MEFQMKPFGIDALIPPMNGNLLFADHAERIVMIGKESYYSKYTAIRPKSISATTQPGATGINATNAAAVATKITGAAQKIGLSAFAGIIISFEINFNPSPINCKIPSTFPQ